MVGSGGGGGLTGVGGQGATGTTGGLMAQSGHYDWPSLYSQPVVHLGEFTQVSGKGFDARQVFTTSMRLNFVGCATHVSVFAACHPDIDDFCGVMFPDATPVLAFSDKAHVDIFEAWFTKYKRFYNVGPGEPLPSALIPTYVGDGGMLALIDAKDRLWSQVELTRLWAWIVTHCEKPVWKLDRFLAFECGKDAAKFKIAYT